MSTVSLNIEQTESVELAFRIHLDVVIGQIKFWEARKRKMRAAAKLGDVGTATASIWKDDEATDGLWKVTREIVIKTSDCDVTYWQTFWFDFPEDKPIPLKDRNTMDNKIISFDQGVSFVGSTHKFIEVVGWTDRDAKIALINELLASGEINETDAMLARIAA